MIKTACKIKRLKFVLKYRPTKWFKQIVQFYTNNCSEFNIPNYQQSNGRKYEVSCSAL